jgi:hypothetical protein
LAAEYTFGDDEYRLSDDILAEVANPRRRRLVEALAGGVPWLRRPLACDGAVVAGPLDPAALADADLPAVCLRMHAVMGSIEQGRCEGRHLPLELFENLDALWEEVVRGHTGPGGRCGSPRLSDWEGVLYEFGEHYPLAGEGPFALDAAIYRRLAALFASSRPHELAPRWQSEPVVALAAAIRAEGAFDRLPILADALEEAGCDNADILSHCRDSGVHVRGCWVVDLILGKE